MSWEDEEPFWGRREKHVYVSKRFAGYAPQLGPKRFVHRVTEGKGGIMAVKQKEEIVLQGAPGERSQVKATLYEDDGRIPTLTIQKFNQKGGPSKEWYFTFRGQEIADLLSFVQNIKRLYFTSDEGFRVADDELLRTVVNQEQAARLLTDNMDVLTSILENNVQLQDVATLAHRRRELAYFEKLIAEPAFRLSERKGRGEESLWQEFFDRNTWIFGYGLSFISLATLDGRGLQNRVAGYNIGGRGKEVDGLLKTQALVNSMCFVEMKTCSTKLLGAEYRPGVFAPSDDLAGGAAQVQVTVSRAVEELGEVYRPKGKDGTPTGEVLYQWHPRAVLVIGSLDEFKTSGGVNEDKFRTFELFRRSLTWPEVITFDELYARAKFIVGDR